MWLEEAQSISQAALDVIWPTVRLAGSYVIATWNPQRRDVRHRSRLQARSDCGREGYFCQESGELFISREIYQHGVPIAHVPELFDTLVPDRDALIMIDGSWPQSIEVLRGAGFNLQEANRGPGLIKMDSSSIEARSLSTKIYRIQEREGGFKWSSQHLDGSCDEHSKTALGSFWAGALVLTRSTAGGRARGAAAILGSDCGEHGE